MLKRIGRTVLMAIFLAIVNLSLCAAFSWAADMPMFGQPAKMAFVLSMCLSYGIALPVTYFDQD